MLCLQFDIFVGVYIRLVYIILIKFEFIILILGWVPQIYLGTLFLIKEIWEKLTSRILSDYWFFNTFCRKEFLLYTKTFFFQILVGTFTPNKMSLIEQKKNYTQFKFILISEAPNVQSYAVCMQKIRRKR